MENRREERFSAFLNYIICFALMGITVLTAFLMPQIYEYNTDRKTIGKVNCVTRDSLILSNNLNLSVKDRAAIVTNLANEGGLSLSLNLDGSQLYDEELIENVMQEIHWAVECGILPPEMENLNLNEQASSLSADYYILSSGVSEYGEMALWKIKYSDMAKWDITLLVDAVNYKIYYGQIGGKEMTQAWIRNHDNSGEAGFTSLCMQYFEAEYAEQLWDEYVFEIEDAGVWGWSNESNNINQPDGYLVTFGFDVFWEYFHGKSLFDFYGLIYENDTTMIQNQNE
ncbi:MAG: hypothetical protein IJ282_08165 [Lachnospiraceae bacterium]|nr:hypothetical protein [Lachnospiraceae bacterium]